VTQSAAQAGIVYAQLERRAPFEVDPLPLDILALLVSCGHAVRKSEVHNVQRLLATRTSSVISATLDGHD
jgi:hypothetical protein